jgi:DNA helicase TIP49 (TBP-interacting protein)
MEPIHEALRLIKRQAELENALRRTGGIRVTEERELIELSGARARYPAAVTAILEAASRMRRPVDTISAEDVERMTLSH